MVTLFGVRTPLASIVMVAPTGPGLPVLPPPPPGDGDVLPPPQAAAIDRPSAMPASVKECVCLTMCPLPGANQALAR
jgi:hypothetical protein